VPVDYIRPEEWKAAEKLMVTRFERWSRRLIGMPVKIEIIKGPDLRFLAFYDRSGPRMVLNRSKLGKAFFEEGITERAISLCIHELGHQYRSDHLDYKYLQALTDLGARFGLAVAADPSLLK
jgi:hypothetical protein